MGGGHITVEYTHKDKQNKWEDWVFNIWKAQFQQLKEHSGGQSEFYFPGWNTDGFNFLIK